MALSDYELSLVNEAKKGKKKAFDRLYDAMHKQLCDVIENERVDKSKSETILRAVFERLKTQVKTLSHPGLFESMAVQLTVEECQKYPKTAGSTGGGSQFTDLTQKPEEPEIDPVNIHVGSYPNDPQNIGGGYNPNDPRYNGGGYNPNDPQNIGGYNPNDPQNNGGGYNPNDPWNNGGGYNPNDPQNTGGGYNPNDPWNNGGGYNPNDPRYNGGGYGVYVPPEDTEPQTTIVTNNKPPVNPVNPVFEPPTEQPVAWLVCVNGADRGRDFPILDKINVIGSSPVCDIQIHGEPSVAAENHACIAYDTDSTACILLTGISGPVCLNGAFNDFPQPLNTFDIITIGNSQFIFAPASEGLGWKQRFGL